MPADPEEPRDERPRPRVVDKRVSSRAEEGRTAEGGESAREAAAEGESSSPPPEPPPPPAESPPPSSAPSQGEVDPDPDGGAENLWTPEQEEAARALARELAERPAADWVLTSAINLANVAGAKLQVGAPDEARLAIDALAGLVTAIGDQLQEAEGPLRQTLAQLQFAYAEAISGGTGGSASGPEPPPS